MLIEVSNIPPDRNPSGYFYGRKAARMFALQLEKRFSFFFGD